MGCKGAIEKTFFFVRFSTFFLLTLRSLSKEGVFPGMAGTNFFKPGCKSEKL
jgi:hypothetical protein